jgi:hypothetical protein
VVKARNDREDMQSAAASWRECMLVRIAGVQLMAAFPEARDLAQIRLQRFLTEVVEFEACVGQAASRSLPHSGSSRLNALPAARPPGTDGRFWPEAAVRGKKFSSRYSGSSIRRSDAASPKGSGPSQTRKSVNAAGMIRPRPACRHQSPKGFR